MNPAPGAADGRRRGRPRGACEPRRRRSPTSGSCSTSGASTGPSPPGVREVNAVVVCTDTFGQRNQGADRRRVAGVASPRIVDRAPTPPGSGSRRRSRSPSAAPTRARSPVERVAEIARGPPSRAPTRWRIADTIGVAVPSDVTAPGRAVGAAGRLDVPLRAHFHDTRNTGRRQRRRRRRGRRHDHRRVSSAAWAAARSRPAPPATCHRGRRLPARSAWAIDTGLDLDALTGHRALDRGAARQAGARRPRRRPAPSPARRP